MAFLIKKKTQLYQTYDGIWAAALAIQYVAKRREHFMSKFEYRVKDWENIFLDALRNTSFEGVTVCYCTDDAKTFKYTKFAKFFRVLYDSTTTKDAPISC